jgi:hypothetical protein
MGFESEATPGAVRQLRDMWENKTAARKPLGPGWDAAFADWIAKFGFGLVADAVQRASVAGYSEDGERLRSNIRDVPKYAAVQQADEKEPGMRNCYLVRGRMRQKFFCEEHDSEVLSFLRRAMRAGVSASDMHRAVDENNTLEDCFVSMGIDRFEFRIAKRHPIVDLPSRGQVFISEKDPEWRIWEAYWRRTKRVGLPLNRYFGWFFPSRLPPTESKSKKASTSRRGASAVLPTE